MLPVLLITTFRRFRRELLINRKFGSKMGGISGLAENLLASQEGL